MPVWCSKCVQSLAIACIAHKKQTVCGVPLCCCLSQSVLGGRSELSASDIPKLVVAEACFREALRLHPPAGQVGRDAAHDTVIKVGDLGCYCCCTSLCDNK